VAVTIWSSAAPLLIKTRCGLSSNRVKSAPPPWALAGTSRGPANGWRRITGAGNGESFDPH
jgi:hypothetical protein